jgi:hypothetical protein
MKQSKLNAIYKEIQSIIKYEYLMLLGNASEVTIERLAKEFEPILIEGELIERKLTKLFVTCLFFQ